MLVSNLCEYLIECNDVLLFCGSDCNSIYRQTAFLFDNVNIL